MKTKLIAIGIIAIATIAVAATIKVVKKEKKYFSVDEELAGDPSPDPTAG